jgi:hypothetical protein
VQSAIGVGTGVPEVHAHYRQLALKHAAMDAAVPVIPSAAAAGMASSTVSTKPKVPLKSGKKDMKSLMKGVVVKKKPKAASTTTTSAATMSSPLSGEKTVKRPAEDQEEDEGGKKKRV